MNIRSKLGKSGWDFSVEDCNRLWGEDEKGIFHSVLLTPTEKWIAKEMYECGIHKGKNIIRGQIKDILKISI